jgi:hypothetical protein
MEASHRADDSVIFDGMRGGIASFPSLKIVTEQGLKDLKDDRAVA